jgi:ABC-2 type transport system permease protein
MGAVCKKELQQFFSSLTGYITIILFLLVNGLFLFVLRDSNIFDYGYATLDTFFDLAPWILIFLVPALSMRSFSDEFRTGTFELLQTKPLTPWQIVLGKFVAILVMLIFVIIPTFIYIFTIQALAAQEGVDYGAMISSYLGLLLLGAVFAAISICSSSFTSNAVIAFLLSAFACVVLYFGFSALSALPAFTGGADYFMEMIGIDFHYRSISRGVIDTRDIIYFGSVIFLFLLITTKRIRR